MRTCTLEPVEFAHYNVLTSLQVLVTHVDALHTAKDSQASDEALTKARDEIRDLLAELDGLRAAKEADFR